LLFGQNFRHAWKIVLRPEVHQSIKRSRHRGDHVRSSTMTKSKRHFMFQPALPPLSDDVLITRLEFAIRLRISLATLHRWVQTGRIPPPNRISCRHAVWHADVVRKALRE